MGQTASVRAELAISDHSEIRPLQDYLRLTSPSVRVSRVPGRPAAGEQGALDVLAVLASSSSLVAAIKVLPDFLRSRKASLSIKLTFKGEPLTLTATNVDEVMPILERLLDD
jgi:hypothetical protein